MYLVREVLLPLRIPMAYDPGRGLLHAVPREAFTVFPTLDDATRAIGETIQLSGDAEFEVLAVEQYESEQTASSQRRRKVAAAAKAAKQESE